MTRGGERQWQLEAIQAREAPPVPRYIAPKPLSFKARVRLAWRRTWRALTTWGIA